MNTTELTGTGHQFKSTERAVSACRSDLEKAYASIKELDMPSLKNSISAAIDKALVLEIGLNDRYNENI